MDTTWVSPYTSPSIASQHLSSFRVPGHGLRGSSRSCGVGSKDLSAGSGLGAASLAVCVVSRALRRRRRVHGAVWSSASARGLGGPGAVARASEPEHRTGVLLMNIGTPASTEVQDVREYLGRFLGDDRVIDIEPKWLKFLVLQVLLGTRPQDSAEAYRAIWDPVRGSPLQFHTEDLVKDLQHQLGDDFVVRMSFQYSAPFTPDALSEFSEDGIDNIILLPMFPQFASGTVGTCLASAYEAAAKMYVTPKFTVVPPFYKDPSFLLAQREQIAKVIGPNGCNVDHMLFSFHGLPEAQCSKAHTGGTACGPDCACKVTRLNQNCYHAQCHETARRLAADLGLPAAHWSVAFQSRLTLRDTVQWIKPYTDEAFVKLAESGVRRLAVAAPSFTIDCLETCEELCITGKRQFEEAGGEELLVVPCVNSSPEWVTGLAQLVRRHTATTSIEAVNVDVSSPGVCPVSGKFGTWRKDAHPATSDSVLFVPKAAAVTQ